MAMVKIEGAEVARLIAGYGFKAKAEVPMRNGEKRTEWYTVWSDANVAKGTLVDIVGSLGVKIEEFTGRDNGPKTIAAIHVNDAKVTSSASAPF
jgi:hypothetical protein